MLALGALFFSCTAQGGSIYAIIETAQKTYVSTLDQTLTVIDLVNLGSATYPLPYFVAAGAIYNGTPPNANNVIGWPNYGANPIRVSPPVSGALCTALTYFAPATALYGAFFTSNGSTMGLYKSPPTSPNFSTAVADSHVAGKQITLLQVANNNLFAVVATPSTGTSGFTYELDSSTDGITFTPTSLTGLTTPITGVGYLGTTYYVTAGSNLYTGTGLAPIALSATGIAGWTLASGEVLNGVTVDNGYVFIPSSNGAVYFSNNGSTWIRVGTSDQINSRSIIFLTVSTHIDTSTPGNTFIVGADGAGFYFLNLAAGTLSRFSDVTVTGLYAGSVRRVLVDPIQNNLVFLGTAGTGLWRTNFDPATGMTPGTWIQE